MALPPDPEAAPVSGGSRAQSSLQSLQLPTSRSSVTPVENGVNNDDDSNASKTKAKTWAKRNPLIVLAQTIRELDHLILRLFTKQVFYVSGVELHATLSQTQRSHPRKSTILTLEEASQRRLKDRIRKRKSLIAIGYKDWVMAHDPNHDTHYFYNK